MDWRLIVGVLVFPFLLLAVALAGLLDAVWPYRRGLLLTLGALVCAVLGTAFVVVMTQVAKPVLKAWLVG